MRLPILPTLALGLVGCGSLSYSTYDPRYSAPPKADVAAEVSALVDDLAQRAELRTPLGSVRVVVDDLVPLEPRARLYRQVALERQAVRDIQATLRNELEISLADRMNVVGGTVISGSLAGSLDERARRAEASHVIVGTFQRDGADVELVVQLVDLRSDWLVAAARRRIERFEPDAFAAPVIANLAGRPTTSAEVDGAFVGLLPASAVPDPVSTIAVTDGEPRAQRPSGQDSRSQGFQPLVRLPDDPRSGPPEGIDAPVAGPTVASGQSPTAPPLPDEIVFEEGPAAARLRAIDPSLLESVGTGTKSEASEAAKASGAAESSGANGAPAQPQKLPD